VLRWGILGTGDVARTVLAPAMRSAGHDLAAVGSRSLSRAQAFAASNGVRRARGSYADVLEAADVEAVFVALPGGLHEEWATAALEAGKHVLCARPLSVDAAAAGRLAAASARAGRLLMEARPVRFHPRTAALIEMVRTGVVGAPRSVHAAWAHPLREPTSFRASTELGGGALLDLGTDVVAVLRWLVAEEPDEVAAVSQRWASGVDGTTAALLRFGSGVTASVTASFDSAPHQQLEVVGTDGALSVPQPFAAAAGHPLEVRRGGEVLGTWEADPVERMVTAFAAACAGERPPLLAVDDAVATASVVDRIAAAS
jgi:predicted dehydrogenase